MVVMLQLFKVPKDCVIRGFCLTSLLCLHASSTYSLTCYKFQTEYSSSFRNNSNSIPMPDSKYSRTSVSSPGGPNRPLSPFPLTPHPYSSSPYNLHSVKASAQPSLYNQTSIWATELPRPRLQVLMMPSLGVSLHHEPDSHLTHHPP